VTQFTFYVYMITELGNMNISHYFFDWCT